VRVAGPWLEEAEWERVTPRPEAEIAAGGEMTYVFAVADPDRPLRIGWRLVPETVGPLRGRIGLEGDAGVAFRAFIYP